MAQAPQPGGYIFLWRSLANNGHLQMPEVPFKLFIYLLLQVNRARGSGCDVGEGWITYRMIKDACCKPDKPWADSTISRALDYLEGNNTDGPDDTPQVYIRRILSKKGGPQRIKVLNFCKYQATTSSFMQEVGNTSNDAGYTETSSPVQGVALEVALGVALEKQEIRDKKKRKGASTLRDLPNELRDDWMRAYEFWYLRPPSLTYVKEFSRFINEGGMTERLIVAVIEKARNNKRRNALAWASPVLAELVSFDIHTVEEWEAFEREREAESEVKPKKARSGWQPREVYAVDEFERKRRQEHGVQ